MNSRYVFIVHMLTFLTSCWCSVRQSVHVKMGTQVISLFFSQYASSPVTFIGHPTGNSCMTYSIWQLFLSLRQLWHNCDLW